jgi:hypothetical protein
MYMKLTALTVSLLTSLLLVASAVSSGEKHEDAHDHEHRQHGAHVHGIAALNLALEGQEVHIEFDSPAANIVGFEHAPSSESDHAALDKAVAKLKDGDRLFRFNDDAGCQMETVSVVSGLLEEEHDGHTNDKPGMHPDEEKEGHDHQWHEDEGETHSEIEAAYHFECDEPGKLTQLSVELFEAFPGTEKLKVQYVIENKQGAVELTSTMHVVQF